MLWVMQSLMMRIVRINSHAPQVNLFSMTSSHFKILESITQIFSGRTAETGIIRLKWNKQCKYLIQYI